MSECGLFSNKETTRSVGRWDLPLVTSAVRNGNEKLVGVLVVGAFAFDDVRAMIVMATAAINAVIGAQVVVTRSSVTGAAPFGAHQHHHITSMSAPLQHHYRSFST